jgi:peroxiredoxin
VLVDPQGKIRRVWRKVDPATTANDTFEAIVDERRADAHP